MFLLERREIPRNEGKTFLKILQFSASVHNLNPRRFVTKVRGFKPDRTRRIFQGEKILSTPSFGREVKSLSQVADLRHVKEP
jgi:hypothetical protein